MLTQNTPVQELAAQALKFLGSLSHTLPDYPEQSREYAEQMDIRRQELQIKLMDFTESFIAPEIASPEVTAFFAAVRTKLHRANSYTIASVNCDHLNMDPTNRSNVYNLLASAHRELDELQLFLIAFGGSDLSEGELFEKVEQLSKRIF